MLNSNMLYLYLSCHTSESQSDKKSGFTLIELSIVLVIIGLIIGGVLVGRDLIKASEIRATVSQIEKYKTAVNTFKLKYSSLPGDMSPATAAAYGLFIYTGSTSTIANNNSILDDPPHESYILWRQLSEANLIDGIYGLDSVNPLNPNTGRATTNPGMNAGLFIPPAKLGHNTFFIPFNFHPGDPASYVNNPNYFYAKEGSWLAITATLGYGVTSPCRWACGVNTYFGMDYGASATEMYAIDSKMDDGMPFTGNIQDAAVSNWAATATGTNLCTIGGSSGASAAAQYNLSPTFGSNNANCILIAKFLP